MMMHMLLLSPDRRKDNTASRHKVTTMGVLQVSHSKMSAQDVVLNLSLKSVLASARGVIISKV